MFLFVTLSFGKTDVKFVAGTTNLAGYDPSLLPFLAKFEIGCQFEGLSLDQTYIHDTN